MTLLNTHLTVQVSQGSAATDLRWGENFNKFLFHNSLLNIVVKKLRKSINICQSYRKNKSVSFFYGPQCTTRQLGTHAMNNRRRMSQVIWQHWWQTTSQWENSDIVYWPVGSIHLLMPLPRNEWSYTPYWAVESIYFWMVRHMIPQNCLSHEPHLIMITWFQKLPSQLAQLFGDMSP